MVRLPDGRSIALEEYGTPTGPVVLYFHGWPACRLEAGLIPDLPARMLSFDRPGYGRSSPKAGRTLLGWADDVAHVADRLGLRRFHVVGLSGGAPFAAAVAHAMPERVIGLALISPVPPAQALVVQDHGVGHLFRLGRHPRVAHRVLSLARPLLQRRMITPRTVVGKNLPDADRAVLDRATLAGLGRVWREGLGRSVEGAVSDAQIYARDWGFALAGIRVPTALWAGAEDSLVPLEALAPYRAIPGVRWHVVQGEGHYSLAIRHAPAMLAELTVPAVAVA